MCLDKSNTSLVCGAYDVYQPFSQAHSAWELSFSLPSCVNLISLNLIKNAQFEHEHVEKYEQVETPHRVSGQNAASNERTKKGRPAVPYRKNSNQHRAAYSGETFATT